VNEPTARCPLLGLHEKQRGKVAVYDSGRRDVCISVLKTDFYGRSDIYQVLSTNGNTHLGGDDIDNLLQALIFEKSSEYQ